jgi:hypothetical protein
VCISLQSMLASNTKAESEYNPFKWCEYFGWKGSGADSA